MATDDNVLTDDAITALVLFIESVEQFSQETGFPLGVSARVMLKSAREFAKIAEMLPEAARFFVPGPRHEQ